MMYKTVTVYEMISDLMCDEYAAWSPQGARALAEYWEDLSEELGEDLEWDRVAMRCCFSEYESIEEAMKAYSIDRHENDLRHNTTVIDCENGHVIVEDF
jgi:glycine/D-amino acid oxidase-like deaminating enzyme